MYYRNRETDHIYNAAEIKRAGEVKATENRLKRIIVDFIKNDTVELIAQ